MTYGKKRSVPLHLTKNIVTEVTSTMWLHCLISMQLIIVLNMSSNLLATSGNLVAALAATTVQPMNGMYQIIPRACLTPLVQPMNEASDIKFQVSAFFLS